MTTGRRVFAARTNPDVELQEHETRRLLQAATGRDTKGREGTELSSVEADLFAELVRRRRAGEPLQYIEGTAAFGPFDLLVDERVLIPRPETEQLWELVDTVMADDHPRLVVDLCTGSGNLAIALSASFPDAVVHATDISWDALEVARQNVATTESRVTLHQGDLYEALPQELCGSVDLITANPPYVSEHDRHDLPSEVRDHEPAIALFAGPHGTDVLAGVIAGAAKWLRPGGVLVCEIGESQADAVLRLVAEAVPPMTGEVQRDLTSRDRFLLARKGMV